jgi:hypothetical protein
MLLLAAVGANASPTITSQDAILSARVCPTDTVTTIFSSINNIVTSSNVKLANLGKEFLKPPTSSEGLGSAQANLLKPLPAVPAAVFMALIGFLCVSFVKDSRLWLAALAGLLWAGQAGIQAVPQLALRLSHRNHSQQQLDTELAYPYYFNDSSRLRSDVEGTQYIGLLHHLAGIPHSECSYTNTRLAELIAFSRHDRKLYGKVFNSPNKKTHTSQPAFILQQYGLNLLFKCLVYRAKQFISFSPAFIFENLARGPPLPV